MNDAIRQGYQSRFQRVLDYIDAHLDENPDVETLAGIAHFSRFHFHRQFAEYFGIGVGRYVQLLRLRRAGQQLAFRTHLRITDIALEAGFESAEAFSRAFRKCFDQNPSAFRRSPDWEPWHRILETLHDKEKQAMRQGRHDGEVNIVDFPETVVAVLEHRGAPERLNDTLRQFIAWRKRFGLSPAISNTWNLLYDDPAVTPPEQYRFGICASLNGELAENDFGVVKQVIPAGRCAVLRHRGPDANLDGSIRWLYGEWLPQSGEELRDFPVFLHRVTLFPDVGEQEMITDIYLPLQ